MDIVSCLTVFGLGAVELFLSIPAGFALGLHPLEVFLAASSGALVGLFSVIFLGEKVRAFILRRIKNDAENKRYERAQSLWEKHGIKGIGLLGPLFFGGPLTAAIGIALGASRHKLVIWLAAGVLIWSAALTALLHLGITSIFALA